MTLLQPFVDRHVILSLEKQFRLFDVIGERDWSADLEAGTLSFAAPKRRLRRGEPPIDMGIALLGTEAEGSWLWGWANPGGFPEPIVAAGRAVGDYGREHDLAPLYEPESPVDDDVTLERIGIVAAGALDLKATYTGPAGDARVLFGLDDPRLDLPPFDAARLLTVLTHLIQTGLVRDWPAALAAYEEARGVELDGVVEIELDDLGRLTNLRSRLG
jgi:hypothetical protein